MAKAPAPDKPKKLTEAELIDVLMWLFTETGHAQHVESYRNRKAKPAAPAGDDHVIEE